MYLVTIKISLLHLHQLREESTVSNNLDVVREHLHLGVTELGGLDADLFNGFLMATSHLQVIPSYIT